MQDKNVNKLRKNIFEKFQEITKNTPIQEYIRLIKIFLEFIKVDGISFEILSTFFLAFQEVNEYRPYPRELIDIEKNFETIDCDLKIGLSTKETVIKEVEDLLKKLKDF